MAATIRRLRFHDGSIRLGPDHFQWSDPYERGLTFEVERVNVAVIGCLTSTDPLKPGVDIPLTAEEYGWIEDAMIAEGLRMAMRRYKAGRKPYTVMLAMPHRPRRPLVRKRRLAIRSELRSTR